jgi:hypothetical protein
MKKSHVLRLGILFISLLIIFFGCKKNENPTQPIVTSGSIGQLVITPNAILANTSTTVTVRLVVPANIKLVDSTVVIRKLDANNNPTGTPVGSLYDDGKLSGGDEIKGDNVYSGIFTLTESTTGQLKLRAVASVKQSTGNPISGNSEQVVVSVLADLTSKDFLDLQTTQGNAATQLVNYLGGNQNNISAAMAQLSSWLQTQPAVESVEMNGSSGIRIKYKSGIYGAIVPSLLDANGKINVLGGSLTDPPRKKGNVIPIYKQTRGTYYGGNSIPKVKQSSGTLNPQIIGNRNVLIFSPLENAISAPYVISPTITQILNNSGFDFALTTCLNQDATISVLNNLTDYGLVVMETHGLGGKEFGTGEVVDTNASVYKDQYKAMLKGGKLAIWKNITISVAGAITTQKDIYAIRAPFISDLSNNFPNSVIFNGSCESTMNPDLQNAFLGKGAKAYYGFSKVVHAGFCVQMADTVVKRLAKDLKNTQDAFMTGQIDPEAPSAAFELKWKDNYVHYADSLINGDFEYGKIYGWTKTGDGRVISQLGSQSPTGGSYMGIISTGLGYTTSTGRISQTFTVYNDQSTLTIHWNFLSEEFLEWIGSSYQDYFKVVIKTSDGVEHVLLNKTIDGLATEFGATKTDPGTLINVSPEIVFDQGGVYMTGWQTSTFDVTPYKGSRITLILTANDIGDSIYDSAILLDDIVIK